MDYIVYFDNYRNEESMKDYLKIIKALGDKNRIRIIKMLEKRPLCVCELTAILELAASTTSNHLRILKDAGLIFERKDGKWVNYYLNLSTQEAYIRDLLPLIKKWLNEDPGIAQDVKKIEKVDRSDLCNI